jgi:hypothetical protein
MKNILYILINKNLVTAPCGLHGIITQKTAKTSDLIIINMATVRKFDIISDKYDTVEMCNIVNYTKKYIFNFLIIKLQSRGTR